jgi:hypothetical protein
MQINCREPEDAPSSSDNRRHSRELASAKQARAAGSDMTTNFLQISWVGCIGKGSRSLASAGNMTMQIWLRTAGSGSLL